MYNLADFIEWDEVVRDGEHPVLIWSRETGYQFMQFGFTPKYACKYIARLK